MEEPTRGDRHLRRLGCSEAQFSISAHLGSTEFFSGGQCDVGRGCALVARWRLGHLRVRGRQLAGVVWGLRARVCVRGRAGVFIAESCRETSSLNCGIRKHKFLRLFFLLISSLFRKQASPALAGNHTGDSRITSPELGRGGPGGRWFLVSWEPE
jgi:hypothetical protein